MTERFTRVLTDLLIYQATVDDPATWARPWTFEVPMRLSSEVIHEYACHEGNEALSDLLVAARLRDAEATRAGEVAGGYQFMRDRDLGEDFPSGWFVSGAGYLTDRIAIVGEVAGSRWSETNSDFDLIATVDVITFLAGVRLRLERGPVVPFVQLLAGGARGRATLSGLGAESSESATGLAIQPGGGVDVLLNDRMAARATFDYRRISFESQTTNQIRVAVGVVMGIGGP